MRDESIDFNAVLDALDMPRPDRSGKIPCPFHTERTASCHIYADGHFHCYGCGAQGDAISFVTRHLHVGYGKALHFIARQVDVDAEDVPAALKRAAEPMRTIEYTDLTERFMNESVSIEREPDFSQRQLTWWQDAVHFARRRWGIDRDTLHAFNVRAAANAMWIPHYHPDGRIVGVKVRNTSTGDKVSMTGSRFGAQLYRAIPAQHCYQHAFVVEGEPDTWKAWAHYRVVGVVSVYGLPGGASTLRQEWANELVQKHSQITLCFDNDAAGVSARFRFEEMVNTAAFPNGGRRVLHFYPEGGKDFTEAYNAGWRP